LIVLGGTTNLTTVLDTGVSGFLDINGLTVASGAGAFIVNPAATVVTLRVGVGGITLNSANNFTIAAPVALSANQTWSRPSGTNLFTVSGAVNLGANILTIDGTGATTISGVVSGTGGIIKSGAGTLTMNVANTYTGAVTVNSGILTTSILANGGTASGIGQSTNAAANLVLNGGVLQYTGAAVSSNRLFTLTELGGTINANGTGALTLSATGAVAFTGSGARTFTLSGTSTAANTLASVIGDGTGGATSLAKTGTGTWVLTATNTYTGSTTVTGGALQFNNPGAIGGTGASVVVSTPGAVAAGYAIDQAFLNRIVNTSTGAAALGGVNSANALDFTGFTSLSLGAVGAATYSGTLTPNANIYRFGGGGGNLTVSSVLPDVGGNPTSLVVVGGQAGSITTLTGTNTYTGTTTISGGILSVGTLADAGTASNVGTGDLILNGGTLRYTGASTTRQIILGTLGGSIDGSSANANNYTNAATGLAFTGTGNRTLTLTGSTGPIIPSPYVTTSLTTATNTFAPTITDVPGGGVVSVNKTGAGTWVIPTTNTYTGTTTISQGTLAINRVTAGATPLGTNTAANSITLAGGTLSFRGTNANPLTVTGFNHDTIVSATDFVAPNNGVTPFGTTASLDNIISNPAAINFLDQFPGFILYQTNQFFPNNGLPAGTAAANRTFVSAANPLTVYRLADYGQNGTVNNNTLLVSTGATNEAPTTGTINIAAASQGQFQTVSALVMGGGGSPVFSATLLFSDNSTTTVTGLVAPDWFNGNPFALLARGRARRDLDDQNIETQLDNPRLYPVDFALSATDQLKTLVGITFTRTGGGGRLAVFGLSGAPVGGATSYANNVTVTANSTIDMPNTAAMALGELTIGTNTLTTTGPANSTLSFTGTSLTGNPTFNIASTAQLFNPGPINYGAAVRTITKNGIGTLNLNSPGSNLAATGFNTLTANAGVVNVTDGAALGATPNLTVSGATVNMGPYTALNALTVTGGTANLPNVASVTTTATLSGGTTSIAPVVTIPTATISGGANTFLTGATITTATISGGTTNFNGATTITTATVNGGTTNLNAAATFSTLSGTGGLINLNGANVLTTGGGNASTSYTGSFGGTGTLVKAGTGNLTLSSTGSSYSGGTNVTSGQLTSLRPGSLGTGTVTLQNGTTLAIGGAPGSTINGFNVNGTGWTLNGGPTIANDVLTITTNANSQTRSVWFNTQQPTGSFTAQFDYTRGAGSGNPADGVTFTLQSQALTALGGGGGGLGYTGITPSAALAINIYAPNTRGIAIRTNGAGTPGYTATGGVDVGSGATVRFNVAYDATAQTLNIQLTQGANVFTLPTVTGVNIGTIVGANAWVGFTGATGGENAVQTISNFTYNRPGTINPPISTYVNAVTLPNSAAASITPLISENVTSFTMGNLTMGTDAALNVVPGTGSLADTSYTLNFGATTLAGTGTVSVANNGTGAGTVSVGAVSGASGNLVKTGPGTLNLSAAATYGGTTTVQQGILRVSGTATPTGAVTVQNGANLLVTGTLGAGGAVAVQNGALLYGTGTVSRPVVVENGGTLQGGLGVVAANQAITTGATTFNNGGIMRSVVSSAEGAVNTTATGASRVNAGAFGLDATASQMTILLVSDTGANALITDGSVIYTRRLATYTSLVNLAEGTYTNTTPGNPFIVSGGTQFNLASWTITVGVDSGVNRVDIAFQPVPEPATMISVAAVGFGLVQLVRRVRNRRDESVATAA
jgi:autotransporter-associated beta strand protein